MGRNLFENLRQGKPSLGCALTMPVPEIVELFGLAGWDLIYFSMHASRIEWDELAHLVRATYKWGITPCARIELNPWAGTYNPGVAVDAHHAFGLGARVILSTVHNSQEVRELVETEQNEYHEISDCSFHELETPEELEEWKKYLHSESMIIAMIESLGAWEDREAITSVPGLGGVALGLGDLSRVLEVDRQFEHPKMQDAMKQFIEMAKSKGVATMINTGYPERIDAAWEVTMERAHKLMDMGVDIVLAEPVDAFLYGQARRFAKEAKGDLWKRPRPLDRVAAR